MVQITKLLSLLLISLAWACKRARPESDRDVPMEPKRPKLNCDLFKRVSEEFRIVCRERERETLKRFIEERSRIFASAYGKSILFLGLTWAVNAYHYENVKELLNGHVKIIGANVLYDAISLVSSASFRMLVESNVAMEQPSTELCTINDCALAAIRLKSLSRLRLLWQYRPFSISSSLIKMAAESNRPELLDFLLDRIEEDPGRNRLLNIALGVASHKKFSCIARLVLNRINFQFEPSPTINVNILDLNNGIRKGGWSVRKAVDFLSQHDQDRGLIFRLAIKTWMASGSWDVIQLFLDTLQEENINFSVNQAGAELLNLACLLGSFEVLKQGELTLQLIPHWHLKSFVISRMKSEDFDSFYHVLNETPESLPTFWHNRIKDHRKVLVFFRLLKESAEADVNRLLIFMQHNPFELGIIEKAWEFFLAPKKDHFVPFITNGLESAKAAQ